MVGAMDESANRQINDLELELEKVAGRAVQEQKQAIQINEILKEYQKAILPVMYRIYINKTCLPKISFVPHVSGKQLNNWFVYKDRLRFSYYRKRLQKLIPGIEFIYWNRHYKMIGQNKNLLPKFVYSNLVKAICLRLKNRRGKDNKLRGYMKFLPLVSRYYSDNPGLVDFVKFGNIIRLVTTSDKIQYLFWKDFRGYLPDNDIFFKGYLVVINKEKLPAVFGLSRFKIRNREDWHNKNISLGWIDESKQSSSHLPYPFSVFRQNFWKKWISSQPAKMHFSVHGGLLLIFFKLALSALFCQLNILGSISNLAIVYAVFQTLNFRKTFSLFQNSLLPSQIIFQSCLKVDAT
jgi:hypothetical protein